MSATLLSRNCIESLPNCRRKSLRASGVPNFFCVRLTSVFRTFLAPSAVEDIRSWPELRYCGAGASRPSTNVSTVSIASSGVVGRPMRRRTKLPIELRNRRSALTGSPLTLIVASMARKSGLLMASEKNSSTFCAPYAVPRYSFVVSNSLVICFVSGCALFDSVALAAAWVISWINVCALIPVPSSSVIVFVSGSNMPAAGRPSAAFRSFLITSFVPPSGPSTMWT